MPNGTCANVSAGDPRDDCPDPVACLLGQCDYGLVGEPCVVGAECSSTYCVDGRCCAQACTGACTGCAQAVTGVADGSCAPQVAGLDVSGDCAGTLACDGAAQCFAKSIGLPCSPGGDYECLSGFCRDGYCCNTACDRLCEACKADWTVDAVANGGCAFITGGQDFKNQCFDPATCTGTGPACNGGAANGIACGQDLQCGSNHCVEGMCCESACTAGCYSCRAANTGGAEGACLPVRDDADPRSACTGLLSCDGSGACYPPWSGTKQFGTTVDDQVLAVAVDDAGNVYAAGHTQGDMDGPGGDSSLGGNDVVVVKFNSSGVRKWSRQFGTAVSDQLPAIALDSMGNVYVAGRTVGDLDGPGPLVARGLDDVFVVKLDSSGAVVWITQFGTANNDVGSGIRVDGAGNVLVCGYTTGDFDGAGGDAHMGNADLFVVKLDPSGVRQWSRQLGTVTDDSAEGIAVDPAGNVYVTGETSADLDGAGPETFLGSADVFVLKLNTSGVTQWIRQVGTSVGDGGYGVAVDAAGNPYVVGWTGGDFDGAGGDPSAGSDDLSS